MYICEYRAWQTQGLNLALNVAIFFDTADVMCANYFETCCIQNLGNCTGAVGTNLRSPNSTATPPRTILLEYRYYIYLKKHTRIYLGP